MQDALYLAWPRAGGDVVIAVDRRATGPRAMRIDPGQPARRIDVLTQDLPAGARVQSLHAFDIEGDGTLELVAAFTGSVRICDVDDGMRPRARMWRARAQSTSRASTRHQAGSASTVSSCSAAAARRRRS